MKAHGFIERNCFVTALKKCLIVQTFFEAKRLPVLVSKRVPTHIKISWSSLAAVVCDYCTGFEHEPCDMSCNRKKQALTELE